MIFYEYILIHTFRRKLLLKVLISRIKLDPFNFLVGFSWIVPTASYTINNTITVRIIIIWELFAVVDECKQG